MSYQPDPKYFRIGNAFTEGIQQSQDNKRRNALLELEQKQYGLQERGLGLREREYEDETAERARVMQEQEQHESYGRRALAKDPTLLDEFGIDPNDPDREEFFAAVAERYGGFSVGRPQASQASSIQEYSAARDTGFSGSYLDFIRQKSQAGQAPPTPGYSPVQLADGSWGSFDNRTGKIVTTGQQAPQKEPAVDPATVNQRRVDDAQNVVSAIEDAESRAGFFTTGLLGQIFGNIGGTDAYGLRAAVDTIKANVGFDRLQRMREESKTGGALGQVAVQELNMLQATIASLDPNQKEETLRKNLGRVRAQYEKAMKAYEAAQNQGGGKANGSGVVDFNSLPGD